MQLIGQTVKHQIFGPGVVTDCRQDVLTIQFSEAKKRFIFPDVFERYLTVDDKAEKKEIADILSHREEARQRRIRTLQSQQEKESRLSSWKISACSQGVFDIREDQDPFEDWSVSTGTYLSGYYKGSPRIPDRMKPNSACLLTRRPKGRPEEERQICGIFMTREDFLGPHCQNGVIHAHPDYRLRLKKPIPFWPYVTETSSKRRWGRAAFRYLNNTAVEPIVYDIRQQMKGTEDEKSAADFYEYYCKVNQLPSRRTEE